MNGLSLLIIGAPALLAVIAFKLHERDDKTGGHHEKTGDHVEEAFQWPRYRARRFSETSR